MKIRGIETEDFINYKYPSMFIAIGNCDWKCCVEGGFDISICQNSSLAQAIEQNVNVDFIYDNYIFNPITEAVVIGGLEPFTQFNDIVYLIQYFREHKCNDTFVIYTGYYPNEIIDQINILKVHSAYMLLYTHLYSKKNSPYFLTLLLSLHHLNYQKLHY